MSLKLLVPFDQENNVKLKFNTQVQVDQTAEVSEYFASMNGHTCIVTNGEELGFPESGSGYAKVVEDGQFLFNGALKEGAKVQQNVYGVPIACVPDRSSGYNRMTLMDINSNNLSVHFIAHDRYHDEQNMVNKNLESHQYRDVKMMLQKRDMHDVYCPTCNFYFTKRVTLPRKPISRDIPEVVGVPAGEVSVSMPLLVHQPEASRVEVIKAIVYGGLLESIASLSIIVSAAGGDATTLNIVALGLANVFGGLLVLANNLMTLKELTRQHYEDQLGQPRHFLMHSTIAVISYLIFGLMSPLIYGFSFYNSNNKYLKLATLAATSLVSITVLSTGKAYVQRPPKAYLQTMLYYISLAVTVSGVAYVAGDLISILLTKLRVFESDASISMQVLEARAMKGMWSPY